MVTEAIATVCRPVIGMPPSVMATWASSTVSTWEHGAPVSRSCPQGRCCDDGMRQPCRDLQIRVMDEQLAEQRAASGAFLSRALASTLIWCPEASRQASAPSLRGDRGRPDVDRGGGGRRSAAWGRGPVHPVRVLTGSSPRMPAGGQAGPAVPSVLRSLHRHRRACRAYRDGFWCRGPVRHHGTDQRCVRCSCCRNVGPHAAHPTHPRTNGERGGGGRRPAVGRDDGWSYGERRGGGYRHRGCG